MADDKVTSSHNEAQYPVEKMNAQVPGKRQDDVEAAAIQRTYSEDGVKPVPNYSRVDAEVAKYASEGIVIITPEENKRLKRLVDKRVLTFMVFTYFLQAIDKGTLSFASIMGIQEDTKLKGQEFSWLTTCIYLAILVVEFPLNWLIQRVPIAKALGTSIIIWGMILCLHAVCKNFVGLVTVRTLLGIFEAICQPAFVYLSSMWYKREEQAATVSYWYMMNGMQQIVGGLLAYCFTLIKSPPSPIKSWQAIFITYGSFSILWGIAVLVFMPDSPMRAKCFSEEDKKLMIERVRSNQTGMQNREFRKEQAIEALKDPQMYCYMLIAICTTLPTSGLGAFANIIIKGFDFTVLQTQLLAMVLGAYIIVVLLSSTWLVKKYNQTVVIMAIYCIPSFVGTAILMAVKNTGRPSQIGLLISYYMVLSFWAAQTLSMSLITRNTAGQTKKTVVITANFVSWCAGNAAGPQVFLKWNAPRYFIAFSVHMGCYVVLIITLAFLRWYLTNENKKKDRLQAELSASGNAPDARFASAFDDLTDKENINFRYVF